MDLLKCLHDILVLCVAECRKHFHTGKSLVKQNGKVVVSDVICTYIIYKLKIMKSK